MDDKSKQEENQIKLYSLLIEELFKHQSNIWQIPTALMSVTFIVIYNFRDQWFPLICLLLFNAGLIFVFYQMVESQKKIIATLKTAEEAFDPRYAAFLPKIKPFKIYSPSLFFVVLFLLEIFLAAYIYTLYCKHIC